FSRDWSSDVCSSDLKRNQAHCEVGADKAEPPRDEYFFSREIHDAISSPKLPRSLRGLRAGRSRGSGSFENIGDLVGVRRRIGKRSEEHTSELQSREN